MRLVERLGRLGLGRIPRACGKPEPKRRRPGVRCGRDQSSCCESSPRSAERGRDRHPTRLGSGADLEEPVSDLRIHTRARILKLQSDPSGLTGEGPHHDGPPSSAMCTVLISPRVGLARSLYSNYFFFNGFSGNLCLILASLVMDDIVP